MQPCDLCGGQNGKIFAEKFGLNYLQCSNCKFVYTDVSSFDFASYNDESIGDLKDLHISKANSPSHQAKYKRLLKDFTRYRSTGRLLEVGCATGSFLSAAEAAGWEGYGVEPVALSARYAVEKLGLNVHIGVLETADFEPGTFDIACSNAVLEHVPSPRIMIEQMYELLRPGGLCYINTVNLSSYTWQFLGSRWKLFDPRMHLSLFTSRTLPQFFEQAGFKVLKVATHGVRFHATRADRPHGIARLFDELRKAPYSFAARRNLKGDNIEIYAAKP